MSNISSKLPGELIAILSAVFRTRQEGVVVIGLVAPATTFAGMLWYDTTAGALKLRDATNTGWIVV